MVKSPGSCNKYMSSLGYLNLSSTLNKRDSALLLNHSLITASASKIAITSLIRHLERSPFTQQTVSANNPTGWVIAWSARRLHVQG
ncbi:hypothetical protein NPIL_682671 [Nephila pilipes]|uniref:Uncharacterized protein n=1 Tax=Nephila pilipes TaxID=299642 RepID=A0A8X6UQX0_NEPPI|nr:hypothetical protein NPIL_682671 [Nephila pilipes]